MNRLDDFRAQKFWNEEEADSLDHKRNKSWSPGDENIHILILKLRHNVYSEDLKIMNKNKSEADAVASESQIQARKSKFMFDNSPIYTKTILNNFKDKGSRGSLRYGKKMFSTNPQRRVSQAVYVKRQFSKEFKQEADNRKEWVSSPYL